MFADPLAGLEEAGIGQPWWVVAGLAAVAVGCRCSTTGRRSRRRAPDVPAGGGPGRAQLTAPAGRPVRGRARAAPSPAASTAVVTAKAAW